MTFLLASFHLYGFDYSHGAISWIFHPEVSAINVTTLLTVQLDVGNQVPNKGNRMLLLNRFHFRQKMQEPHVKGGPGWIQQHTRARLVCRQDRIALNKSKIIGITELASKMTNIVRYDYTVAYLIKTILNCIIPFEKE